MARQILEHIYVSEAVKSMASANPLTSGNYCESSPDVFGLIKRKLVRVQANIEQNCKTVFQAVQGIGQGTPVKRKPINRNSNNNDHDLSLQWPCQEQIEMAQFFGQGSGKGHHFIPCQLYNPTWCDNCGDFIWGISKQCVKCGNCQYTCHHTCVPSVTLDCTPVSPTEVPSTPDGSAAETSLSDRHLKVSPQPEIPTVLEDKVSTDVLCSVNKGHNLVVNKEHLETTPLLPPLSESEQTLEPSNENDETDSGYRSGTIPDEKLPKLKGEATLNREEIRRKIDNYNQHVPTAVFEPDEEGETFQGFLKVTLNFIRPITMSLGVRPPSIYEMLTKEHIVEQNTQSIAFYMPRDTVKSIHTSSSATTREVITGLLKKFHIIDHPRKFAMYEQEFDGHKIVKLRRVQDKESPLNICLNWDTEHLKRYRLVLQENETGEIVWEGFSLPELNNFLFVLQREENEYISQLQYKYKVMRRIISQRLKELRKERRRLSGVASASASGSSSPSTPGSSAEILTPTTNSS